MKPALPKTAVFRHIFSHLTRPVDALPIDIFRVLVGIILFAYFIRTFLEAPDFSSPDGLLDHTLIVKIYWFTEMGIFRPSMSTEIFQATFLAASLSCLPIIFGYRVKLFAAVLYVIAVSTYRRNFIVMYVDDSIMHLLLFWMLVLPVGRTLAVRELMELGVRNAWQKWKTTAVPGFALRCFFGNLILLYLVAGLWKWTSPMWIDGTALYAVLKLPISYYHDFWNGEHIPLLMVLNYVTLVLEPLIPLLFVLPRGSYLKYLILTAFLGLHLGSVATLNIPFANLACAAVAVLVLREEIMAFLRRSESSALSPRLDGARIGFSGAAAAFMVATLTLAMVSSIPVGHWRIAARELRSEVTPITPRTEITDGRAEGLSATQLTFFGTLWLMGIAQQYQLFNWIDDRNYAATYRVFEGDREVDAGQMFVRSLRGVLLDFYIHDVTWMRIPAEHRDELRRSILERTAKRYCRNQLPTSEVTVFSTVERIDPKGGPGELDSRLLMRFQCGEAGAPVFLTSLDSQ